MDTSGVIQLVVLVVLILLSAFFSSAENSLTTLNRVRLKTLVDEGNRSAMILEKILANPGKMLSTILIGNNVVNISATSLATTLTIRVFGDVWVGLATGILTVVILLFGEIVPKTWALSNTEKIALTYSYFIYGLMWLLTPVIFIVDKLVGVFLWILRVDPNKKASMTESELKTYVDVSHEDGVIESEEREMILNVFDFGDSCAKDIMIPRIDMTTIDVEASYKELQSIFIETKYSRIPVYEGDTDNIIGIVTFKDFFLTAKKTNFSIRDILREAYYTYEYKKTNDLLIEMRESAINIAIVLDEYGASVGLVTLEDLLEEIVGEIRDEYDEEEKELIKELAPDVYLVEGSMKLDDINDAIQTTLDSDNYDSIGGILIETLDRLPNPGEEITLPNGTKLAATIINKNRIEKVTITLNRSHEEDTVSSTDESSHSDAETDSSI